MVTQSVTIFIIFISFPKEYGKCLRKNSYQEVYLPISFYKLTNQGKCNYVALFMLKGFSAHYMIYDVWCNFYV